MQRMKVLLTTANEVQIEKFTFLFWCRMKRLQEKDFFLSPQNNQHLGSNAADESFTYNRKYSKACCGFLFLPK